MNGLAYLVRDGHPLRYHSQAPWTTRAQFSCGARGTDGWYGCYRSALVRFKGGRVGFAEVELASMPVAAKVLRRLGVVDALTLDSGGGAMLWTRRFGNFGTTAGTRWSRLIPMAVTVR